MAIISQPEIKKAQKLAKFIANAGESSAEEDDLERKPIMLRIPSGLLKRIDAAARRKGVSRCAFIVGNTADVVNGDK